MPTIPDLTRSSRTDPTWPPHCASMAVVRKPPGATFLWTATLGWDLAEDTISSVVLPQPFARDRGDILAAFGGEGPAYKRSADVQAEVQASVYVRVGVERLPIVEKAPAIVRRITVAAAEGSASVKVLLRIEAPRSLAPELLDLIDADCDVEVVTNGELFEGTADPEPGDEVVLEREAAAEKSNARANAKRNRAPTVTDLDDDLPAEA